MAGLSWRLSLAVCGVLTACSPSSKAPQDLQPPRHVVGLHALEASTEGPQALVATRSKDGKHFLEVVTPQASRWSVETTPLSAVWRAGFLSVQSDDTHVYALLLDAKAERAEIQAFRLQDGQKMWTHVLPKPHEDMDKIHSLGRIPLAEPLHVAHGRLLAFVDSRIVVLEALSGKPLWSVDRLEATPRTAWMGKDFIAIDEDQALVLVDAQTGEGKQHYVVNGSTCRAGDEVLWAQTNGLRVLSLTTGESQPFNDPSIVNWVEACGKVGQDWAIAGKRDGKMVAQRVSKEPKVLWEKILWGQSLAGFGLLSVSQQGQGELGPRWGLALYERQLRGAPKQRYVSLDLGNGDIKEEREGEGGLFRTNGVSLIGQTKRALSILSNEGQVVASFESIGLDVTGGMARGGVLWVLLDRETGPQGEVKRAAVDLKTGQTLGEEFGSLPKAPDGIGTHFPKVL